MTAGDFDNDMYVDLFLTCGTGASNTADILYRNHGDGTFVAVPNAGGAAGPVGSDVGSGAGTADSVVTADYDVDGFLDLFVTNGMNLRPLYYGGPNKLFHNNGNGNHWIELDLVATKSERDATGARIYATAGGVTQLRVQNGAYHRWSQDFKRSHFGLAEQHSSLTSGWSGPAARWKPILVWPPTSSIESLRRVASRRWPWAWRQPINAAHRARTARSTRAYSSGRTARRANGASRPPWPEATPCSPEP